MTIIHIEDQGQDFTEFYVDDSNVIIDAQPFQGWLWTGYQITNKIRRRAKLQLRKGPKSLTLKYRVVKIEQRTANVQDRSQEHPPEVTKE